MNHLPTCVKDHTCSNQSQWQLLCCYNLGLSDQKFERQLRESPSLWPKDGFYRSYCILLKVERPYILLLLRNFAFFISQRLEQ